MTVQTGDVLRAAARLWYTGSGNEQVNTYFYELVTGGPLTDAVVAADLLGLMEEIYTHVLAIQSSDYSYADIAIKNITQDILLGTFSWPTLVQGTGTGVLTSAQVCALIFGRTAISRVQMRKYFGGLQEEDVSDSVLTGATLTALTNAGIEIIATQGTLNGTYQPIAYNELLDRRTVPVSVGVSSITRTQRRRTRGRGS